MKTNQLQKKIECVRAQMVEVGMNKGLSHPDTVEISQRLDELLNQLQRQIQKEESCA